MFLIELPFMEVVNGTNTNGPRLLSNTSLQQMRLNVKRSNQPRSAISHQVSISRKYPDQEVSHARCRLNLRRFAIETPSILAR